MIVSVYHDSTLSLPHVPFSLLLRCASLPLASSYIELGPLECAVQNSILYQNVTISRQCPATVIICCLSVVTPVYCYKAAVILMCENIFFNENIIRVCNSLPPSIVSFKSLFSFRNSFDNVNLGIYIKY